MDSPWRSSPPGPLFAHSPGGGVVAQWEEMLMDSEQKNRPTQAGVHG